MRFWAFPQDVLKLASRGKSFVRFIFLLLILFFALHPGSLALAETAATGYIRADAPDHSLYGRVLSAVVRGGSVDYSGFGRWRMTLEQYIHQLSFQNTRTLGQLSSEEAIAFWINAYNAITLKYVVQNYPVKSIKDIRGVWNRKRTPVGAKQMTLDHIEHKILRKEFQEPRIHFALVCASRSCPELKPYAYEGARLGEQLDEAASTFLNDPSRNRIDPGTNVVYLSKIFDWYGKDFVGMYATDPVLNKRYGKKIGAVLNFAKAYLSPEKAAFLEGAEYEIQFLPYDWDLNDI